MKALNRMALDNLIAKLAQIQKIYVLTGKWIKKKPEVMLFISQHACGMDTCPDTVQTHLRFNSHTHFEIKWLRTY